MGKSKRAWRLGVLVLLGWAATGMGGCGQKRYTITLARYTQQGHELRARELMTRAKKVLKGADVWTAVDQEGTSVNYGYFADDKAGGPARRELERVRSLREALQTGMYQFYVVARIPEPDPPARASWNLVERPCEYSLEIAVYFDVPEFDYYTRKADAVAHVRKLRDEGEQAYFVHGRFESRVYVRCLAEAEVVGTDEKGRLAIGASELVKELLKTYEFRQENNQRLYTILPDDRGQRVRVPQRPVVMKVAALRQNIPF